MLVNRKTKPNTFFNGIDEQVKILVRKWVTLDMSLCGEEDPEFRAVKILTEIRSKALLFVFCFVLFFFFWDYVT